jgi:hypothetical protein
MKNRSLTMLVGLGLIVIFCLAASATFYLFPSKAGNESLGASEQVIGNTSYGYVVKEGPYGNNSSNVKIAVIVGVHPLESDSHQAMVNAVKNYSGSLKYSYTIYRVNVTEDAYDYEKGRMNGQLLANHYAVPDIEDKKFNLAIDVHSNVGNWDKTRFVFAPVNGSSAESIATKIKDKLPWLSYYTPPNPTSTVYVTAPLINAGIPAFVYETYHNDSSETIKNHAVDFLMVVDNQTLI